MSGKPTIVIVPGAWQTPPTWDILLSKLKEAGYETEYVKLPTVGGTDTPLAGLADDVSAVRIVLDKLKEQGKRSILLSHSSGGLVSSNAIEGYTGVGIIFLTAFIIPKGKALLDLLGGQPLPWMNVQVKFSFPLPIPSVFYRNIH